MEEVTINITQNITENNVEFNVIEEVENISVNVNEILGSDGKSAYQIATENGFLGTESDWLLSLKGNVNIVDLTLPVNTNGQILFNIFTQPSVNEKHYLLINGVEHYQTNSYNIINSLGVIKLQWLNEFPLLTTFKVIFRKYINL